MESKPSAAPRIEPLGQYHAREAFSCGNEALDRYLHRQAGQDVRRRGAATFVLVLGHEEVAGFYSLSSTAVHLGEIPEEIARKLPQYKYVPAILLGRLAVGRQHAGRRFGALLLTDALRRSLRQSREVGAMAVVVDAKDDSARSFYAHFGFIQFPQSPCRLFLPMGTVEKLYP